MHGISRVTGVRGNGVGMTAGRARREHRPTPFALSFGVKSGDLTPILTPSI